MVTDDQNDTSPRQVVVPGREPPSRGTAAYFIREALRRMWLSRRTSFVAVGMITIALLTMGAFLLIAENLSRAVDAWHGKSKVAVYFEHSALPEEIAAVDQNIGARPGFEKRQIVSREEAVTRFKSYFTNLSGVVDELDQNPFPASVEVEVTEATVLATNFDDHVAEIRRLRGVDDVQFDWEWIARLKNIVGMLNAAGLIAGGILAIAAAFTIANVIRLTMVLYREEIDIMRLVGATEKIVRGPFLVEGFLQGLIGGVLAVALLYGAFSLAQTLVVPSTALLWEFLFKAFLPWTKVAALIAGGVAAGMIGTWLSLRHFSEETPVEP